MACETKPSLSPFLDGELPEKELSAVAAHLDDCGRCRKDLSEMRALGGLLKALPERPLPTGFKGRLERRRLSAAPEAPPVRQNRSVLALAAAAAAFAVLRAAFPPKPPEAPPVSYQSIAPDRPVDANAGRLQPSVPGRQAPSKAPQESLSNEALHERMLDEARTMGIKGVDSPSENDLAEQALRSHLESPKNRAETRVYMRRLAALRRSMGIAEPITVPITGKTSILLAKDDAAEGGPVKTAAERAASRGPASEPVAAALEHGWAGLYGGANDSGTQTVLDAESWKKLWRSLSTAEVPPVDFARFEAVAVFLGPRPSGGFSVEITEVKAGESFILVRYQETTPPEGRTPPEGLTSPFALRVIDKSSLPVRFEPIPK